MLYTPRRLEEVDIASCEICATPVLKVYANVSRHCIQLHKLDAQGYFKKGLKLPSTVAASSALWVICPMCQESMGGISKLITHLRALHDLGSKVPGESVLALVADQDQLELTRCQQCKYEKARPKVFRTQDAHLHREFFHNSTRPELPQNHGGAEGEGELSSGEGGKKTSFSGHDEQGKSTETEAVYPPPGNSSSGPDKTWRGKRGRKRRSRRKLSCFEDDEDLERGEEEEEEAGEKPEQLERKWGQQQQRQKQQQEQQRIESAPDAPDNKRADSDEDGDDDIPVDFEEFLNGLASTRKSSSPKSASPGGDALDFSGGSSDNDREGETASPFTEFMTSLRNGNFSFPDSSPTRREDSTSPSPSSRRSDASKMEKEEDNLGIADMSTARMACGCRTVNDDDLDGCRYSCPKCSDGSFSSLAAITCHVRRIHGGELAILACLGRSRVEVRETVCRICGETVVHDRVELGHHLWKEHGLPPEAYAHL